MSTANGPAYAAFDRLITRFAVGLRIGGAVAGTVGALLGLAAPARPAVVVAAVLVLLVWAAAYAVLVLRHGPLRRVVAGDMVVVAVLCLGYGWLVPERILPGWSTWLAVVASSAVVISQLTRWSVVSLAGLLVVPAAYAVGGMLAGQPSALAGLLVVQGVGSRLLMGILRLRARATDAVLADQEELRREEAVRAGRRAEEREHARLLHDSVSATLTVVAAGGAVDSPTLRAQARRDLDVVELIHSPAAAQQSSDLRAQLAAVVAAQPLAVQADLAELVVPPEVAAALAAAVGEGLANAARHAGVDRVRLSARPHGQGVEVELADEGQGFDPDRVPATRRGVRESIVARLVGIGGSATVSSERGVGTTLVLRWPDPGAATPPPAEPTGVSELVASRYQRAFEVGVVWVLAARHVANAALLSHRSAYRSFAAELAAWAALAVIGVFGSVRLLRRRTGMAVSWLLAGAVLAASTVATAALAPGQELTGASWAVAAAGWFGVLVLLRRPVAEVAVVIVAAGGFALLMLYAHGLANRVSVAELLMSTYALAALQLVIALVARALDGAAQRAATAAESQAAVRQHGQVAEALHRGRLDRYRTIRRSVVPLLSGLARGELDPTDRHTQRRCAVEASRLRRLFAETDDVPDPLLHELRACADIAYSRGVLVDLHVVGRLPTLSLPIRRALTEAPLHALAGAERQARVTVLGRADEVAVSVLADAGQPPDMPTRLDPAVTVSAHGNWIEARWHS